MPALQRGCRARCNRGGRCRPMVSLKPRPMKWHQVGTLLPAHATHPPERLRLSICGHERPRCAIWELPVLKNRHDSGRRQLTRLVAVELRAGAHLELASRGIRFGALVCCALCRRLGTPRVLRKRCRWRSIPQHRESRMLHLLQQALGGRAATLRRRFKQALGGRAATLRRCRRDHGEPHLHGHATRRDGATHPQGWSLDLKEVLGRYRPRRVSRSRALKSRLEHALDI